MPSPKRPRTTEVCASPGQSMRTPLIEAIGPDYDVDVRKIQFADIRITRILGSGGFGTVFKGYVGGKCVAVKKMHAVTKNALARLESYRAELNLLQLKHPNVVRTLAASPPNMMEEGSAFIVMEYAGELNLQTVISDTDQDLFPERRIRYGQQIANALVFAHNSCLVHLDLKPQNVLISDEDICKLGDFGCCQRLEMGTGRVSPTQRSTLTGTYAYRAPELLRGEAPTTKADVFAFGVTLWQMFSRQMPYSGENQHVVIFGVVAYNLRPSLNKLDVADPFEYCYRELFTQCWDSAPQDRPASKELVEVLDIWKQYV